MKYVINKNLAGSDLRMGGETYAGSPEGVFEVSDEHAEMLLATPGWAASAEPPKPAATEDPRTALQQAVRSLTTPAAPAPAAPAPQAAPEAPAAAAEAPPADSAPEPPQAPEPGPTVEPEEEPEDEDEEEGPDLASMDKTGLLAVAKQYEVKVPSRISEENLRKLLDKELYGEGDNNKEE